MAIIGLMLLTVVLLPAHAVPRERVPGRPLSDKEVQKIIRKARLQEMEKLKNVNPPEYKKQRVAFDRLEKIKMIAAQFKRNQITEKAAASALFTLVEQAVQPEMADLDDRITKAEKKLVFLKQSRNNPELLVQRRIEELLGKRQAEPDDLPALLMTSPGGLIPCAPL